MTEMERSSDREEVRARATARENDGEAAAAAETADHKTYDEGDGHEEGEGEEGTRSK